MKNSARIKVYVVEDALQTRRESVDFLMADYRFDVVGQAGTVREALLGIEATSPEAVILDISLPDGSGVEILKNIRQRSWEMCVIVLTGNPYEALRVKCQLLGAIAVFDKLNGFEQALDALLLQCSSRQKTNL